MTKTSKRTHPLDRDGDGQPGGSLPGNETAPMAEDAKADAADDQAAKLDAMNRETDEANAAAREAAGWTRDEDRLLTKLDNIGARFSDLSTKAVIQSWSDQEAFTAENFADAMLADGHYTSDDGEEFNADGTPIVLPPVLADWEIHFEPAPVSDQGSDADASSASEASGSDDDTAVGRPSEPDATATTIDPERRFFARIIQAPREADEPLVYTAETDVPGLVIQADTAEEAYDLADTLGRELLRDLGGHSCALDITPYPEEAVQALDAAFADSPNDDDQDDDGDAAPTFDDEETEAPLNSEDDDDDDDALDASADRTQVAARIRDLTILVGARRLYKSDEGYSSNYGAPYVGHDTIAAFVQAGLAEDIPSAGNQGGVKLTAEARRMLADLKREAAA